MTILTLNRKELEKKVGKITPAIEDKITMMGTPVEEVKDSEVSVEVFPNRPDLLSMQGFTRSLLQYLGKTGVANFKVNSPEKDYKVKIDKSVKKVRPFTACCVIKGLKLDDEKIKEIIDIQEKLHLTLGRKRKKLAIGIYPMEKIKMPIRFMGKNPDEIKFIPLEMDKEITGRQILSRHPAGRDYAHLLEGYDIFPFFIDADNKVLSMPPIINSHETGKINEKTKDVFIECSGFNLAYLKKVINILAAAFSDLGGKIYAMEIEDPAGNFISPNLEMEKMEFKISDINKTLGLDLNEKDVKNYLAQMGIGFEKVKDKTIALIPSYRTDILHWIDLTEEVALAYGYENFKEEIPAISTIAQEDNMSVMKRKLREILAGLELLEVSSFHLAVKSDVKKIYHSSNNFIEVIESKTEYDVLRNDLLSNLCKILSENLSSTYPQKIFEIGRTFEKDEKEETGIKESEKLAIALTDEKVNFTDLKQVLDYLMKMMDKEYTIEETEHEGFIEGRSGKILVDKKMVGVIGEVCPRAIRNWKLKMPVAALELDVGLLMD